jgi:hypothetical protein
VRDRYDRLRQIEALDPVADHLAIYRMTATLEFPWDMTQALSLALFRTYAVPSIGRLLATTGEFTERAQRRYDDTGLLLDAVLEHGPDGADGRAAIRRINQMHRRYDISDDDMRYVLSTFVVTPIRWLDAFGWRPMSVPERVASAEYHRVLGRHLGIPDLPRSWAAFIRLHDEYERARFGPDPGGRAVADSTLDLLATFPPFDLLPAAVVRQASLALLDDRLRNALGHPAPPRVLAAATRAGLRARGLLLRLATPRREPVRVRDSATVRSHPDGYEITSLGTFPTGCPVPPGRRGDGG